MFSFSDDFIKFCLNQELLFTTTNNRSNTQIVLNDNNHAITLPKLGASGLSIIVFSDGSSSYYPYFIASSNKVNNNFQNDCNVIRFLLSKSDFFSKF
jgi:hypothetical protein